MKTARLRLPLAALLGAVVTLVGSVPAWGQAAGGKPAAKKPIPWMENFNIAQKKAQKEEKPMLLYFCASDWDDWTMKLEDEVMNTPLWTDWAVQNLILVKIDFPKDTKKQRPDVKNMAEALKTRFSIARVPTFIFLDPWGDLLSRVGYNTARLRDDEPEGQPKKWLEFCQQVVASRPAKERLEGHATLQAAVAAVRKTAVPLCILVYTPEANQTARTQREELLTNQLFVRFINRNMGFVQVMWPSDTDVSPNAKFIREFASQWKFGPSQIQLVIWDPGGVGRLKAIIGTIDSVDCAPLVKRLETMLPTIDYGGGWLEDWKVARLLSGQQNKDLLISFVSSDGSEYSKRMEAEIYSQPEFKAYAKDNLILMKVDFPADKALQAKQSPALIEQNNMLADMFGVQGYPTVIVLNPKGHKILNGKYMKGGAGLFVSEMKKQITADRERRTVLSQELSKELERQQR